MSWMTMISTLKLIGGSPVKTAKKTLVENLPAGQKMESPSLNKILDQFKNLNPQDIAKTIFNNPSITNIVQMAKSINQIVNLIKPALSTAGQSLLSPSQSPNSDPNLPPVDIPSPYMELLKEYDELIININSYVDKVTGRQTPNEVDGLLEVLNSGLTGEELSEIKDSVLQLESKMIYIDQTITRHLDTGDVDQNTALLNLSSKLTELTSYFNQCKSRLNQVLSRNNTKFLVGANISICSGILSQNYDKNTGNCKSNPETDYVKWIMNPSVCNTIIQDHKEIIDSIK